MNQMSIVPANNGLRHRFVEDMTVRGFSDIACKYYIRFSRLSTMTAEALLVELKKSSGPDALPDHHGRSRRMTV